VKTIDNLNKAITIAKDYFEEEPDEIKALPKSGSARTYYRIWLGDQTYILALNDNVEENEAFLEISKSFKLQGVNIPDIYHVADDRKAYILEDLGSIRLYDLVWQYKKGQVSSKFIKDIYRNIITKLLHLQWNGGKEVDYKKCYPREEFDCQSVLWDLNYFKYMFLKLMKVDFDEQALENDFEKVAGFINNVKNDYFMFRDFQSRNIMIKAGRIYFIDYQGGRKGPLYYDIASLLYESGTDLSDDFRQEMLEFYMNVLQKYVFIDETEFKNNFYFFVLIRKLQALGAYGYRGIFEGKGLFLQSIYAGLANVMKLFTEKKLSIELPEIQRALERALKKRERFSPLPDYSGLIVTINSFSYREDHPVDISGNGGGFMFDCRFLPNPGRETKYMRYTGQDEIVIEYLEKEKTVKDFLYAVYEIVDEAVEDYRSRNFKHLMVSFGCTGGQHRSVYCANKLRNHLQKHDNVMIRLNHKELQITD
jgi:aminoglycoside/choline kinase family phosphotransferase